MDPAPQARAVPTPDGKGFVFLATEPKTSPIKKIFAVVFVCVAVAAAVGIFCYRAGLKHNEQLIASGTPKGAPAPDANPESAAPTIKPTRNSEEPWPNDPITTPAADTANTEALAERVGSLAGADIYEKAAPAVVVIYTESKDRTPLMQGSGFFLSPGDIIVTNWHVIEGAAVVNIKTRDGRTAKITNVLAVDKLRDLAVLPVPETLRDNQSLALAQSRPRIGEDVYAIGAPRGLAYTFTGGRVSQIRHEDERHRDLIQIDVKIDHGSSGGALVNSVGEIVGVTSEEFRSANFAVAASEIETVCATRKLQSLAELLPTRPAVEHDPETAASYYDRGCQKFAKNDLDGAVADLTEAIRLDPKNSTYLSGRALAYTETKNYDSAIHDYQKAINLDAKNGDLRRGIAVVLCHRAIDEASGSPPTNLPNAIRDLDSAIWYDSKNATLYFWRGRAKTIRKDNSAAIADYDKAIKLDPTDGDSYYFKALTKFYGDDWNGVMQDCATARRLHRKFATDDQVAALADAAKNAVDREAFIAKQEAAAQAEQNWKAQWRKLSNGIGAGTVKRLIGEPSRVSSYNFGTAWYYDSSTAKGGYVFIDKNGTVSNFSEPTWNH